jgi:hypothetical protein
MVCVSPCFFVQSPFTRILALPGMAVIGFFGKPLDTSKPFQFEISCSERVLYGDLFWYCFSYALACFMVRQARTMRCNTSPFLPAITRVAVLSDLFTDQEPSGVTRLRKTHIYYYNVYPPNPLSGSERSSLLANALSY